MPCAVNHAGLILIPWPSHTAFFRKKTVWESKAWVRTSLALYLVAMYFYLCTYYTCSNVSNYPAEMEPLNPELEVVTSSPHAIESHPFELICVVHNFYPDEISWTKDGVPISAGSGIGLVLNEGALLFDSLEVSDSGTYCCQVPAGDVEQVLERCTELTVVG